MVGGLWSVEGQELVGGPGRREEGLCADRGHFDEDELTFQVGDAAIDMRPELRESIWWAASASSAASVMPTNQDARIYSVRPASSSSGLARRAFPDAPRAVVAHLTQTIGGEETMENKTDRLNSNRRVVYHKPWHMPTFYVHYSPAAET